jgi:hypothetical protein
MASKLTQEEFIELARSANGDRYSYEKALYTGNKNRVTVTCPDHGDFETIPSNHFRGAGCPKCSVLQRAAKITKPFADFGKAAYGVHGRRYKYDESSYKNTEEPTRVICGVHGDFNTIPTNHLKGQGCPKCGRLKQIASATKPFKTFLREARAIHGNQYKYDESSYRSARVKMNIICPVHGEFTQEPMVHLRGNGCKKCGYQTSADALRITNEEFKSRLNKKYGRKITAEYTAMFSDTLANCKEHGDYKTTCHAC